MTTVGKKKEGILVNVFDPHMSNEKVSKIVRAVLEFDENKIYIKVL